MFWEWRRVGWFDLKSQLRVGEEGVLVGDEGTKEAVVGHGGPCRPSLRVGIYLSFSGNQIAED